MKVFLELLYKNSEGVRVVRLISLRIADMNMSELVTQKPESLRLSRFLATTQKIRDSILKVLPGAPNDNFRKIICLEDDLRSRIFGSFSEKFLACLPLLGFSNFKKIV